jgi:hypothetical protein
MVGHDNTQNSLVGQPLESDPGRLGFNSRLAQRIISYDFVEMGGDVWIVFGITFGYFEKHGV